ncbi:hypothetical protein E2320_022455, partial [Naja naja]
MPFTSTSMASTKPGQDAKHSKRRVATTLTPLVVYGVVDLYGMAVKVTIVHNHNHSDRLRRNNAIMRALSPDVGRRAIDGGGSEPEPERLLFHPNCGQKAAIINEGRTALRP